MTEILAYHIIGFSIGFFAGLIHEYRVRFTTGDEGTMTGSYPYPPIESEVASVMNGGKPRKVCLCGSTRFKVDYEWAAREETIAGRIVLSVGLYGHNEALDMEGPLKEMLDKLHLRKIDECDEVLVINTTKYIGPSTAREIRYAADHGKPIRYLYPDTTSGK